MCTAGPQPGTFPAQCVPLDLNLGLSQLSVHRWTSTWDLPSSVYTAGPQRPDKMTKDMPDRMSDKILKDIPENMPDRMLEGMPNKMPVGMPDKVPEYLLDKMSEDLLDKISDKITGNMLENMPNRVPEDMPEQIAKDIPTRMPENISDRMPDKMPEGMPDRMLENLSILKYINIMVGIIRNNVFFSPLIFLRVFFIGTCGDGKKNKEIDGEATKGTTTMERSPWLETALPFEIFSPRFASPGRFPGDGIWRL